MTWRDKLDLGLKNDARYRKENLTPSEIRGPEIPTGPGRSAQIPMARDDKTEIAPVEPPEPREREEPPDIPRRGRIPGRRDRTGRA